MTSRRTAFVPRILLSTVFLGVVPACALAACSSTDNFVALAVIAFDADSGEEAEVLGVASDAFNDDSLIALADIGFRSDTDPDATDANDGSEAGDGASDSKSDVPLGVAADAFSG